jgi:hypothetical protein
MNRAKHLIILFYSAGLSLIFLTGCISAVEEVAAETDPSGWDKSHSAVVRFDNRDTVSVRNIDIFIVCNDLSARNHDSIGLSVTTLTPDSLRTVETITLYTAGSDGDGNAGYYHVSRPYRHEAVLSKEGEYLFEFSHEYETPLKGVKAIGITVK